MEALRYQQFQKPRASPLKKSPQRTSFVVTHVLWFVSSGHGNFYELLLLLKNNSKSAAFKSLEMQSLSFFPSEGTFMLPHMLP